MTLFMLFFIIILLFISAFFSGSETALTAVSRARMHSLANQGNKRAKAVNHLLKHGEQLLSSILIGNNLVNILASVLATNLFLKFFGEIGLLLATLLMTVLVIIFSEVLPKTYALSASDQVALRVAPILNKFVNYLIPLSRLLNRFTNYILTKIKKDVPKTSKSEWAREDIRSTIDLHHLEKGVTKKDRDMLGGILDLKKVSIDQVMVHRKAMQLIDANLPYEEIIRQVLQSRYTRIPFWQDNQDNIIGILHTKKLFQYIANPQKRTNLEIHKLLSEPWFVPETTSLATQMAEFRNRKIHFSLIINEYGGVMGLVTLEDILEEIVGQIEDEYDAPDNSFLKTPDGGISVDGTVTLRDINRNMGWLLPDKETVTIAGLIMHETRCIPKEGQIFTFYGFRFRILRRKRNQITLIEIHKTTKQLTN